MGVGAHIVFKRTVMTNALRGREGGTTTAAGATAACGAVAAVVEVAPTRPGGAG